MTQPSLIRSLIAEARRGDLVARDRLFDLCRNYVSIVARTQVESWMRTKVDASDLVQQTLLDAHRNFEQFTGEEEAEWLGWLRAILRHNTQDFVRQFRTDKRAANREVHIDRVDGRHTYELADSLQTASEVLMQHEQELRLANAIAQLKPEHQDVIQLRTLQRLSFADVAERMDRSRPAVQMLWLRAVDALNKILSSQQD